MQGKTRDLSKKGLGNGIRKQEGIKKPYVSALSWLNGS